MRYGMLVLLLGAALHAQTPPVATEPAKPAVQPGEFSQSQHDPFGVTAAPGKAAEAPVPMWRLIPPDQSARPLTAKWKLFPSGKSPAPAVTTHQLLSYGEGTQLSFVNRGVPGQTVVITQEQVCAILLTNVLPRSGMSPKILHVPIPDAQFPMAEVRPPAPSCDDRK